MTNTFTTAATRSPTPGATSKQLWRVRTDKGDVFGPADLDTLKAWARDSRIAPTNEVSEDGQAWTPVTALHELEMDWVAEVTTGSFYGPIHEEALAELVREGSIGASATLFRRATADARQRSAREQALENRLLEMQQQLYARVGDLESQLNSARGDLEQARSALDAKDLEFDAERQEQKASQARLQAELVKRDGRIAALEQDVRHVDQVARERQELERRLAESEQQASAQARRSEQVAGELAQARAVQRDAERTAAQARERLSGCERETESLRDMVRTLKLRLDGARKLMQQVGAVIGGTESATDAEIVEPHPPTSSAPAKDGPPPLASPAGGVKPGMSLADLEAQAQRELRQLGGKGATLFKSRGKG